MYEYQEKVRYSETDSHLKVTIPAMLNYYQDCAIFESENVSLSIEALRERHMTWVLNSWQVEWIRRPKLNEDLIIGTMPYNFKGFLGYRNFYMDIVKDGVRTRIGQAASMWTLLDTEKMMPTRLTPEIMQHYPMGEKLDMNYKDRHIRTETEGTPQEMITVKKSQIDSNHHVNNAEYVNMVLDFVPKHVHIRELRVEYKKQAFLGDEIIPVIHQKEENSAIITLKNREEEIYAVVEFIWKTEDE